MTIIGNLPKFDERICTAYIADAERHPHFPSSWLGVWGVPGTMLSYVSNAPDEGPVIFHNAKEATCGAREMGFAYLNRRVTDPKRKFDRLTGEQFAASMAYVNMNETDVAGIWGATPHRVQEWQMGRQTVPFPFWWALPLMRKAEDRAFIIHESAQHRREPTEE